MKWIGTILLSPKKFKAKLNLLSSLVSYHVCASGMMSSITTYTIAPAANARAYGNIGFMIPTNNAPSTPAIGSTNPLSCPYLELHDWN